MIISDTLEATLSIGGVIYDLGTNTFESICIVQNALKLLPECRLILNDTMEFFERVPLVDGIPILIQIASLTNSSTSKTYPFILYGKPQITNIENGKTYVLYGIYDRISYLRDRPYKSYTGNSSQVIRQVADDCNFKFDGDTESIDYMTWYSGTKSYGQFVQSVSDYGYFNNNSCTVACVTIDGILKYKNITGMPKKYGSKAYFYYTSPNSKLPSFRVLTDEWLISSGFSNMLYGYKYNVIDTSISGYTNIFSDVKSVKSYSNKLNINSQVNNLLQSVRTEFGSIDCGNTHDNWWKAYHQNKRLRCTYSTDYMPLVVDNTNLQLLDVVEIENVDNGEQNIADSTFYIVTSKTQMISDDLTYREKLQLTTTGKNINNSNLV